MKRLLLIAAACLGLVVGTAGIANATILKTSCSTGGWAVGASATFVDSYSAVPKRGNITNTLYLATSQSTYKTPYGTLAFYRYQISWVNLSNQNENQYRYTANESVLTPSLYGGAKAGTMTVLAYWNGPGNFDSHCIRHSV